MRIRKTASPTCTICDSGQLDDVQQTFEAKCEGLQLCSPHCTPTTHRSPAARHEQKTCRPDAEKQRWIVLGGFLRRRHNLRQEQPSRQVLPPSGNSSYIWLQGSGSRFLEKNSRFSGHHLLNHPLKHFRQKFEYDPTDRTCQNAAFVLSCAHVSKRASRSCPEKVAPFEFPKSGLRTPSESDRAQTSVESRPCLCEFRHETLSEKIECISVYFLNSLNDIGAEGKQQLRKYSGNRPWCTQFFPVKFFVSTYAAWGSFRPKSRGSRFSLFFRKSQMELLFPDGGSTFETLHSNRKSRR